MPVWPLALYFVVVVILAMGMLGLSFVLGERHKERATGEPYESGILPTGSGRTRLSVKFYPIALFFLIFDLEAAFIYAWAIALRDVGWTGYIEVLVFIGVLLVTLVYLWRVGALDWRTARRKSIRGVKE
jgi:NADH-quinone oxidoreductase subunit A